MAICLRNKVLATCKINLFFSVITSVSIMAFPFSATAGDAVVTYPSPGILHAVGTVESTVNKMPVDGDLSISMSTPDKKSFVVITLSGGMTPAVADSINGCCNGSDEYYKELKKKPKRPVQNFQVNLGAIKPGDKIEVEGLYNKTVQINQEIYSLDFEYVSSLAVLPKNSQ